MTLIGAIKAVFGRLKNITGTQWQEVGGYTSRFTPFGRSLYANDVARACIRALAEHSSKANVRVIRRTSSGPQQGDAMLERMIQYRPNLYMNGKDFLYKVRTLLEINNTVFVYVNRDDSGRCIGLYPVPTCPTEALDVDGALYIRFYLPSGLKMAASWDDLAVLRKDYNSSDIYGDDNTAILTSLDLLSTTNQGMANAIKSTANLRGVLKSTKAMLTDADRKRQQESFVADYMGLSNQSGVAMVDSTMDFTPITMQPQLANYKSVEELRNNIYRYFGVNEAVLTSTIAGDQWEAFYEGCIEGFLLALSLELSHKIFTARERGYGNEIVFEANRMQYMSMTHKLALVAMVDRGAMLPNEWRQVLNLAPIEGGDVPIRRLDTAPTTEPAKEDDDNADQNGAPISGNEPAGTGDDK